MPQSPSQASAQAGAEAGAGRGSQCASNLAVEVAQVTRTIAALLKKCFYSNESEPHALELEPLHQNLNSLSTLLLLIM